MNGMIVGGWSGIRASCAAAETSTQNEYRETADLCLSHTDTRTESIRATYL